MQSELTSCAREVLERYAQAFTFDSRDLGRPSAENILGKLIEETKSPHRERLQREFFAEGPLTELLADDSVQEIVVNGAEEIWFERQGAFHRLSDQFLDAMTFKNFVDRLCAEANVKVDLTTPFVDGRWRNFRLHLGCAPLTHCAFHLTLRRFPENPWTLEALTRAEWCSEAEAALLLEQVSLRKNMIFLGPTGCGKTTVLGATLKKLAPSERVVLLEDTDELPRPNTASSKLLTRPGGLGTLPEVNLSDLVRQSLRMRPFRLVMGEVRGGEAKDLLMALATGHSGSMGTIHASDARQALLRLEMLVQLGAPQWSLQAIRQLIALSVDVLVVCGTGENGKRVLKGLSRIAALESVGFLLEPLEA